MLHAIRTVLAYVFLTCLVAGLLGGMLTLCGSPGAGGPLLGIGLAGTILTIPLDFFLSWLAKPRPVARGFEVKLVSPTDDVKHE